MKQEILKFDRQEVTLTINAYIAEQEKDNGAGSFSWKDYSDVSYLLNHLNSESNLPFAFDSLSNIGSEDGGTIMVSSYSFILGANVIIDSDFWALQENIDEFLNALEGLFIDTEKIIAKIK